MEYITQDGDYAVVDGAEVLGAPTGFRWMVFVRKNGRLERAKHLGRKSFFKSKEEADTAAFNARRYGTQNV